jgi:hypothetical protein
MKRAVKELPRIFLKSLKNKVCLVITFSVYLQIFGTLQISENKLVKTTRKLVISLGFMIHAMFDALKPCMIKISSSGCCLCLARPSQYTA